MDTTPTTTHNLRNGYVLTYNLPPAKAVVNAWYQGNGNWNTWEYDYAHAPLTVGRQTIACGDCCALAKYRCIECAEGPQNFTEGMAVEAKCPICGRQTYLWPITEALDANPHVDHSLRRTGPPGHHS